MWHHSKGQTLSFCCYRAKTAAVFFGALQVMRDQAVKDQHWGCDVWRSCIICWACTTLDTLGQVNKWTSSAYLCLFCLTPNRWPSPQRRVWAVSLSKVKVFHSRCLRWWWSRGEKKDWPLFYRRTVCETIFIHKSLTTYVIEGQKGAGAEIANWQVGHY